MFIKAAEKVRRRSLQSFIGMCVDIGAPVAPEKTHQPANVMSFLGYEQDTLNIDV